MCFYQWFTCHPVLLLSWLFKCAFYLFSTTFSFILLPFPSSLFFYYVHRIFFQISLKVGGKIIFFCFIVLSMIWWSSLDDCSIHFFKLFLFEYLFFLSNDHNSTVQVKQNDSWVGRQWPTLYSMRDLCHSLHLETL